MDTGLRGKVALVTGASGGIGSAIPRAFAAEGAKVILHYHKTRRTAQELAQEIGLDHAIALRADLSKEKDVKSLFREARRRFGHVDTLVANAASWAIEDTPLHKMSVKHWQSTIDGVLTSTFLTVREFLLEVAERRRGNIVLIGSTAAVFGEAGHADYAAAKAAIAFGLTRTLKNEIARIAPHTRDYCGGRVNCVVLVGRSYPDWQPGCGMQKWFAGQPPQWLCLNWAGQMIWRAQRCQSDRLARHITGQTVVVAGGMEGRPLWLPNEINPEIA